MSAMNIENMLSQQINLPEIRNVVSWADGSRENLERLWELVKSDDRRIVVNALWSMTHLPASDLNVTWLVSMRDKMIDMLLAETDSSKKRMLLQLLREQEYDADNIRTDFLDWCLSKINAECEPYAVRCFSIYAAFKMCRHFPELVDELESNLEMMRYQTLSPGLKSALRQTTVKIEKLKKKK